MFKSSYINPNTIPNPTHMSQYILAIKHHHDMSYSLLYSTTYLCGENRTVIQ